MWTDYRQLFGESGADVDDRVAAFLSELDGPRLVRGGYRVLARVSGKWTLDRPFGQWRESPDGEIPAS